MNRSDTMRSPISLIYTVVGLIIFVILPAFYIISDHIQKNLPGNDYIITNISGRAAAQYNVGHILDFGNGRKKIYRKKSEWIPLQKNMKVGSGANINLEKNALVDIKINSEVGLRIKKNSLLRLTQKETSHKFADLALSHGKLLCRVNRKKSGGNSKGFNVLRVLTPTATAYIRGTSFSVDYHPSNKITNVEVLEGLVSLKSRLKTAQEVTIPGGKKLQITPHNFNPLLKDITAINRKELLETRELKLETSFKDRWEQTVGFVLASPIYKKVLVEITKYEMKVFIRAMRYFAPLRWGNSVPNSLRDVELEEGDYRDPWAIEYLYDKIDAKRAVLISAGPDNIFHTSDDIFMSIKI